MMSNPMSMVPMTSNVNIKVIDKVVGVYNLKYCKICIRDSGSDILVHAVIWDDMTYV